MALYRNSNDEKVQLGAVFLFENCIFYNTGVSVRKCECVKKLGKMEKKNIINLFDATYFLINIFKNYKTKYACPVVKIQKMMLILHAHFYLNDDDYIFDKLDQVKATDCAFKIPFIAEFLGAAELDTNDVECTDEIIELTSQEIQELLELKVRDHIFNSDNVKSDLRKILINLFRYFGAYKSNTIGNMLEKIKPEDYQQNKNGEMLSIKQFNEWTSAADEKKKIDEYLKQYFESDIIGE